MKKIFALVLVLCLLCGMTALAAETKTTELKAEIAESYEIEIPANLDITFGATSTNLPVKVTALRTLSKGVNVANSTRALCVTASNYSDLKNQNGDTIRYFFGPNGTDTNLYFTAKGTQNFPINITESSWNAAPAGTYTDTITFNIRILDYSVN